MKKPTNRVFEPITRTEPIPGVQNATKMKRLITITTVLLLILSGCATKKDTPTQGIGGVRMAISPLIGDGSYVQVIDLNGDVVEERPISDDNLDVFIELEPGQYQLAARLIDEYGDDLCSEDMVYSEMFTVAPHEIVNVVIDCVIQLYSTGVIPTINLIYPDGGDSETGSGEDTGTEPDTDVPPCDPDETPGTGLFVSPDGNDTTGTGTEILPFKTIYRALSSVSGGGIVIYLAQGTYEESLDITGYMDDIVLYGGWLRENGEWTMDCEGDVRAKTLIKLPEESASPCIGATVEESAVEFKRLTIATKSVGNSPDNQNGESCYGIQIFGQADVTLQDVAVIAGQGGDGGRATQTISPPAPACSSTSVTNCSNGYHGEDGEDGEDAFTGYFVSNGYIPGQGSNGTAGMPGNSGTFGQAGYGELCYISCSCGPGGNNYVQGYTSAGTGRCGCGGNGGNAGRGGLGGGASVAVFVSGNAANVSAKRSELVAGSGGNGSSGATSQSGSVGKSGQFGNDQDCYLGCNCNTFINLVILGGGVSGGPGGNGGDGGNGGGGSGGPSVGIAKSVDSTAVFDTATQIVIASGGDGAGDAAPGIEDEILEF